MFNKCNIKQTSTRYAKLSLALTLILLGSTPVLADTNKNDRGVRNQCLIYNDATFDVDVLDELVSNVFDSEKRLIIPKDRKSILMSERTEQILRIRLSISNSVSVQDLNRINVLDKILQFTEVARDVEITDPLSSYFIVADFIAYLVLDDYQSYADYVTGITPKASLSPQGKRLVDHFDAYEADNSVIDDTQVETPLVQHFNIKLMKQYAIKELDKYRRAGILNK